MGEFNDKRLLCIECKNKFPFTAVEQERYMKRGLRVPKRCFMCRKAKKERYRRKQKDFLNDLSEKEINVREKVCLKVVAV